MTGVAGGLNLPWSMLNYLKDFGSQPMNAFTLLGYSFQYYSSGAFPCSQPTQCGYARIWGMLRDLDRIQSKRPTWLAVELVNKAVYLYLFLLIFFQFFFDTNIRLPNLHATVHTGDNPSWLQTPINSVTSNITINCIFVHSFFPSFFLFFYSF